MKQTAMSVVLAALAATIMSSVASAHGCHDDIRRDDEGWHRHIAGCDRFAMSGYRPSGKWTFYEIPWLQGDPRQCIRTCHRYRAGRRWCQSCN